MFQCSRNVIAGATPSTCGISLASQWNSSLTASGLSPTWWHIQSGSFPGHRRPSWCFGPFEIPKVFRPQLWAAASALCTPPFSMSQVSTGVQRHPWPTFKITEPNSPVNLYQSRRLPLFIQAPRFTAGARLRFAWLRRWSCLLTCLTDCATRKHTWSNRSRPGKCAPRVGALTQ